jgi:replicative DNA helicase
MKTDEAMLLSQIMLDQSFYHELCIDEGCFLRADTRAIYNAITSCIGKGVKPDLIAIRDADKSIDLSFLISVQEMTHSAANWKYYENKVLDAYKRHKLYDLGCKLKDAAKDSDVKNLIEQVESSLMSIHLDNARERVMRLDEYGADYVNELKYRFDNKGDLRGISSGFESLDAITYGFQNRRLYYIGARPSQGKSALMVNCMAHVGLKESIPCGIISIESSGQEILERIFSQVGGIPGDMLATGFWGPSQMADIGTVAQKVKGKPFYIYDRPNIKLSQVKAVSRVMKKVYGVKIIFIDYLQLIRGDNARAEKVAVVGESSQGLKELARELDIPIVCAAQLGRDADDKRPGLGTFQWASQIEADADCAMLIWHERKDDSVKTKLLVEKNRDGKKADLDFRFDGEYYRFVELEKE